MLYGYVDAVCMQQAATNMCPCCMDMSMLYGYVDAIWICRCCMYMSMLYVCVDAVCI